ncbi:hypothetical protein VB264_18810 [Arcicella aquatica]|uniref:Addiction module component n=1 Tax=Arcicella aquatica TaxID=217141 RepID=A0ABU5QS01_9BACT|nr:hypothetical protein [Arcicella aquatica]MEA5259856.1 hypothetical protein [Arcicella aquatica]
MLRTSIIPQQRDILLSVPQEYVGKKIEVLVYAIEEIVEELPKKVTMADFWGKMSDESAQKIHDNIKQMRNEWEQDI